MWQVATLTSIISAISELIFKILVPEFFKTSLTFAFWMNFVQENGKKNSRLRLTYGTHCNIECDTSHISLLDISISTLYNVSDKSHGLLKSDKLYTELSSEHRNGCTLLHTWCTDEYEDDIQVPSCAGLGCDWLSWLMCEDQICMKCAWARCDVRRC